MSNWPGPITAITIFTEDLARSKAFYRTVFDLPVHYEDDASAVFLFGETMINVLVATEAVSLIEPATVADAAAGSRAQFTLTVDDVDATAALLQSRGAELLNGPVDRPWGIRTASFRDPGGHIWEIAQPL